MKLSECLIGTVVALPIAGTSLLKKDYLIGHITGLTKDPAGHVIPVVRFADDDHEDSIDHSDLKIPHW